VGSGSMPGEIEIKKENFRKETSRRKLR